MEENFFYTKTSQEDLLLTKSIQLMHNILVICFEELYFKYQNDLNINIKTFLSNTKKVFFSINNRNYDIRRLLNYFL